MSRYSAAVPVRYDVVHGQAGAQSSWGYGKPAPAQSHGAPPGRHAPTRTARQARGAKVQDKSAVAALVSCIRDSGVSALAGRVVELAQDQHNSRILQDVLEVSGRALLLRQRLCSFLMWSCAGQILGGRAQRECARPNTTF